MSHRLPILGARAAETALCTYCPKLCRPACPVSTVEGRETVTPWGKMRAMGEVIRGAVAVAEESTRFELAWDCTACGHCRELCLLDNPADDTLMEARAEAVARGAEPEVVRRFRERFPRRLERLRERANALEGLAHIPAGEGGTAYLPGCTAVTFEPESVAMTARAVAALDPSGGCTVIAGECCGAPLLDAGDIEGFRAHARRFVAALSGFRHVVTSDAGCAWTLRRQYVRHGIDTPAWQRVDHITELAARNLPDLTRVDDARKVIVHDSCRLGRGLGVYDAPRAVLRALTGEDPREMPTRRERASCTGGGALLLATRPATAKAIAHEVAGEAREVAGVGEDVVVVTSCASSRRQFRAGGVAAEDIATWIARGVTYKTE